MKIWSSKLFAYDVSVSRKQLTSVPRIIRQPNYLVLMYRGRVTNWSCGEDSCECGEDGLHCSSASKLSKQVQLVADQKVTIRRTVSLLSTTKNSPLT